jgi:hypothetical protein
MRPWLGNQVHRDAVHRAGRDAEFATGAAIRQHVVLVLGRADDGVDRARADALGAADAAAVVDGSRAPFGHRAARAIECKLVCPKQAREGGDRGRPAGWAAVDLRHACGNGLGIRSAPVVAAAAALRLRKQVVDLPDPALDFPQVRSPFVFAVWPHRR